MDVAIVDWPVEAERSSSMVRTVHGRADLVHIVSVDEASVPAP